VLDRKADCADGLGNGDLAIKRLPDLEELLAENPHPLFTPCREAVDRVKY
jgi:hypothetical protein